MELRHTNAPHLEALWEKRWQEKKAEQSTCFYEVGSITGRDTVTDMVAVMVMVIITGKARGRVQNKRGKHSTAWNSVSSSENRRQVTETQKSGLFEKTK